MQGFMEEQKATAGLNRGDRHTATAADGQATPTNTNQPPRPPTRQPCPTPTSHPDYKEHHVTDTTK